MTTTRVTTARLKMEEGHYDRPEIIAAGAYDVAKQLIGRQHAKGTQLRWLIMNADVDRGLESRGAPKDAAPA